MKAFKALTINLLLISGISAVVFQAHAVTETVNHKVCDPSLSPEQRPAKIVFSAVALSREQSVDLSRRKRIPLELTNTPNPFRQKLNELVVGQDEALEAIQSAYSKVTSGLAAPGRPLGNFLFLGPTGTGKTRAVEATAEALFKNPKAVIKIDCAEFQHSHEIAKLVGSPPGYLGHRETHPMLSQEVLNQYHTDKLKVSIVLFDEIEKASDSLWNILLGILDKGTLTLGDNRKVDFSKTLIFMTSNVGVREMQAKLKSKRISINPMDRVVDLSNQHRANEATALGAARSKFSPEFINRLDKIVVFKPLNQESMERILRLELQAVQNQIYAAYLERSFTFQLTEAAFNELLENGISNEYGARFLKRLIDRSVVSPLSNLIDNKKIEPADVIEIDLAKSGSLIEQIDPVFSFAKLEKP